MPDPSDLVARRQRYIQRQIETDSRAINVQVRHARPEGSGPANRHGLPKLPTGQHIVKNWPVLDLGEHPDVGRDRWRLEVGGLVENPGLLGGSRLLEHRGAVVQRSIFLKDFACAPGEAGESFAGRRVVRAAANAIGHFWR